MTQILIACAVLLFTGLMTCAVPNNLKSRINVIGTLVAAVLTLPVAVGTLISGHTVETVLLLADPVGSVRFVMDPLAAFFLLPISIGGFLTSLYSIGYMKPYADRGRSLSSYYLFLSLLTASMMAVVLVRNVLFFLVVWEIMSLSSFFLVMFEHEKEDVRKAGLYYLTAMQIGAALLIAAFAISVWKSGSLEMDVLSAFFSGRTSVSLGLFLLFFAGFGVKAGFIPLHTWLPKAHPAAPSPVSALMSGVMIKTGIYGILRMLTFYGRPETGLSWMVFFIAAATGVWGIINAAAQKDMKRLLAFSSIENIGIIGMGLGIGMVGLSHDNQVVAALGFAGSLMYILAHFVMKSILFYGAGAVYLKTHIRNMEELGGLSKTMPITSLFFLIASLAICGMPLMIGFAGKFALYLGLIHQLEIARTTVVVAAMAGIACLAGIGVVSILAFTKLYAIVFQGTARTAYAEAGEVSLSMRLAMALLGLLLFVFGLFPQSLLHLVETVTGQLIAANAFVFPQTVYEIYETLSKVFGIAVILILFFVGLRFLLLRGKPVRNFKTWDCGFQKADGHIQYTGSSFASPFLGLVGGIVPQEIREEKPEGLFPQKAHFESRAVDRIESFLIRPVLRAVAWIFGRFDWIQSGKTQQYILYGLIFLIGIIAWIVGVQR